jgi:hypothetical protein
MQQDAEIKFHGPKLKNALSKELLDLIYLPILRMTEREREDK